MIFPQRAVYQNRKSLSKSFIGAADAQIQIQASSLQRFHAF